MCDQLYSAIATRVPEECLGKPPIQLTFESFVPQESWRLMFKLKLTENGLYKDPDPRY